MSQYLFLLLLFALIHHTNCDLSSTLSTLQENYVHSNYLAIGHTSVWWSTNNSLAQFALLGRTNQNGWMALGLGPTLDLAQSVFFVGRLDAVSDVFRVSANGKFDEISLPGVHILNVSETYSPSANFTLMTFTWDMSVTNSVFNLTAQENLTMSFLYGIDDLNVVPDQTFQGTVILGTGENASPYRNCDLFRNCKSIHGTCVDQFKCQCKAEFIGPECSEPAPSPPPPPPGPSPDYSNYEHNRTLDGMKGVTLFWNVTGQYVKLAVEAKDHIGYIGFGINSYEGMIGADAVIGWREADGTENITTYNLTSKRTSPHIVPIPDIYKIHNARVWEYNGTTAITFERNMVTGQHIITSNDSIILAALGITPDPSVKHHSMHVDPCCPKVNFKSGSSTGGGVNVKLVHGIVMTVAWGLLLPLGVLAARYLKDSPNNLWFTVHKIVQPIGFLISLIGGGIIIYQVQYLKDPHFASLHPISGLIILSLGFIQVAIAVIRPKHQEGKSSTIRKVWENKHWWLGRLLLLASWAEITFGICKFSGLEPPQCFTDETYRPYFIGFWFWILLLLILTVILECKKSKSKSTYIQIH